MAYGLDRRRVVVKAAAWAVCAAFFGYLARTNEQERRLLAFVLDVKSANLLFGVLAVLGALWCTLEIVKLARYPHAQRIALTQRGLVLPESLSLTTEVVIPWTSIVSWSERRGADRLDPVLRVVHATGTSTIRFSMLPSERDYAAIAEALGHACPPPSEAR